MYNYCRKIRIPNLNPKKHSKNWKGGRYKDSRGYIWIWDYGERYYEHQSIMEKFLGRCLKPKEEIHHINGNKSDNRIENLKLCNNSLEHSRYEFGWVKIKKQWYKNCPQCNEFLIIKNNFYKRSNGHYFYICKKCCSKNFQLKKYGKK